MSISMTTMTWHWTSWNAKPNLTAAKRRCFKVKINKIKLGRISGGFRVVDHESHCACSHVETGTVNFHALRLRPSGQLVINFSSCERGSHVTLQLRKHVLKQNPWLLVLKSETHKLQIIANQSWRIAVARNTFQCVNILEPSFPNLRGCFVMSPNIKIVRPISGRKHVFKEQKLMTKESGSDIFTIKWAITSLLGRKSENRRTSPSRHWQLLTKGNSMAGFFSPKTWSAKVIEPYNTAKTQKLRVLWAQNFAAQWNELQSEYDGCG